MDIDSAHRCLAESLTIDVGRFYSTGEGLSLGVGLIYAGIRYPVFDSADELYLTIEGTGLILTHECDIDQANSRPFTELAIVCPVTPFEAFVSEYSRRQGDQALRSFIAELGRRTVSRVAYIPGGLGVLPYGGILYLNQLSHTHISQFLSDRAKRVGALTAYGLTIIDLQLTNHLLRPKAEALALTQN